MTTCPSCGQQNPDGFKLCGMCGAALGTETTPPREERKVVTVLFADLVGFTARAEQLDPEDVRALLSPYYTHLRSELERYGGTVEKFIGDAVMALFGAPVVHEDDPERAVRAALEIRDWIREQSDELEVRIAVNTGEALIRLGADTDGGEGMASGDVVNTAARLQSSAPVNGVLVGETTHRATRHAIEYREAQPVEAKGKANPVAVWEALQPRARLGVDLLREVKTPLIGREAELDSLRDALGRARGQRSPQLLTLTGEPGIGKSRLVFELMQVVAAEAELIRWRQGRCLPYGEGVSFWALAEMVKAEAAILETDSPGEVAEKLHVAVEAVHPAEGESGWIEGHLRTLVGVGEEAELGPERWKEAFAAWRRFLEALARERSVVLVFEDLHWADDGLLDFVDHLVDWASGVPILVLATARPELLERRSGWGGGKPNSATITVAPLTDEETHRLIAALLEQPLLAAEMQAELLSRAGGNPLYAEQYVRMVAEHSSPQQLPLPETVQGIIAARLDLLSDAEKQLIQNASVVGKVFWSGAVAAIDGAERWQVEEQLHALERKEFVQRAQDSSVAGETEYAFRHLLVRDVAYGQIPRRERVTKHLGAAGWIESLARPDDHAETLAHHYGEALELARAVGEETDVLVERARSALRIAGDRASSLGSVDAALGFYRNAMALWPAGSPEWARLVVRYRRPRPIIMARLQEDLVRARDVLLEVGELEEAAEAELYLSWDAWNEGRGEDMAAHQTRVLALTEQLPPSHTKAYLLGNAAIQLMLSSELDQALETAGRSLEIADHLGLADIRAHALNTIGTTRAFGGDRGGIDQLEESLALSLELNHAVNIIRGYKNLGSMLFDFGEIDRLPELIAQAEAAAERFADDFNLRWFRIEHAQLDYLAGRWDESLESVDAFIAEVESGSPHYMEPAVRSLRAQMLLARGQTAAALEDSGRAVEYARGSGEAQVLLPALAVHACALFAAGRLDEAARIADEVVAGVRPEVPTSWACDVAPVLLALGRGRALVDKLAKFETTSPWEQAAVALLSGDFSPAVEIYVEVRARPREAEARLLAAKSASEGDPAASEHLERALAFFQSVRAEPYIRETEQLLGAWSETRAGSA